MVYVNKLRLNSIFVSTVSIVTSIELIRLASIKTLTVFTNSLLRVSNCFKDISLPNPIAAVLQRYKNENLFGV
jgi:hypothetical protein